MAKPTVRKVKPTTRGASATAGTNKGKYGNSVAAKAMAAAKKTTKRGS